VTTLLAVAVSSGHRFNRCPADIAPLQDAIQFLGGTTLSASDGVGLKVPAQQAAPTSIL